MNNWTNIKLQKKPARISAIVLRLAMLAALIWIGSYLLCGSLAVSKVGFGVVAIVIVLIGVLTAVQQYLLRKHLARKKTSSD